MSRGMQGLGRTLAVLVVMLGMALAGLASWATRTASALTLPTALPIAISLPVIGELTGSGGASAYQPPPTTPPPPPARVPSRNPFRGRAMWIWELPSSSGGDVGQIISKARYYGVSTLIIKSSDGTSPWEQFSHPLVSALRAAGLRVCAWQYVYGQDPAAEARVGAAAVRAGASCLVIDAETEYEGRYSAAQRYLSVLRSLVGARFPIGLAGFPWIDYHPAFPYSVFFGPGGAQYNLPQMYWKDIGVTVDEVYSHTFMYNRLYLRPIYPLGQLYNHPSRRQVIRFRQLADAYGARGVSWWDYQEATGSSWRAIGIATARLAGFVPDSQVAILRRGSKGDLVVWAQEHLYAAGDPVHIDGDFGPLTRAAVVSFQAAHGLTPRGVVDASTWAALLRYAPAHVNWWKHTNKHGVARIANLLSATSPPLSASLPGRNELHGAIGRGR